MTVKAHICLYIRHLGLCIAFSVIYAHLFKMACMGRLSHDVGKSFANSSFFFFFSYYHVGQHDYFS